MLSTIAFVCIATAAADASPQYVYADILNVRDRPAPDGRLVAQLRINTTLEVLQVRGDWALLRTREQPLVKGWGISALLGPTRLTSQIVDKNLAEATTPSARRMWAERGVALEGHREDRWIALRAVIQQTGDKQALDSVDAYLQGRTDTYLAVCERTHGATPRAVLLGRLRPGKDFQTAGNTDALALKKQMRDTVRSLAWFELWSDQGARPVAESPFATPFLTRSWNEEGASPYVPGTCEGELCGGDDDVAIILGPCAKPGLVLATRPLQAVPAVSVTLKDAARIMARLGQDEAQRTYADFRVAAIEGTPWFQVELTSRAPSEAGGMFDYVTWGLVGVQQVPLVAIGKLPDGKGDAGRLHQPRWFALREGAKTRYLVVHDAPTDNTTGYALWLIGEDGSASCARAVYFGAGC